MLRVKIFKIRLLEEYQLEDESLLNDFMESVKVVDVKSSVIHAPPEKFWTIMVLYELLEEAADTAIDHVLFDTSEPLTPEEETQYLILRGWRDMKAREENIPPYMVLHASHLKAVVKVKPGSRVDFLKIAGLSRRKIEKYADELLRVLQDLHQ